MKSYNILELEEEKKQQRETNETVTDMVDINQIIPIVTLNMDDLNIINKKQGQLGVDK